MPTQAGSLVPRMLNRCGIKSGTVGRWILHCPLFEQFLNYKFYLEFIPSISIADF